MPLHRVAAEEALARLDTYSAIIDVRSPGEHALDRVPGARNWPVLDDRERALIGTEYTQVSPFMARKRGAVLVARNIARHLDREALDLPKDWRPLVYCWRGGQRSGAMATVLAQIGFRVDVLEGGYQAYRRAVIAAVDTLPARLHWTVLCGRTGTGKSRLLRALARRGAQVLDLEALANHRGSVLGLVPGQVQPGQKQFESRLYDAMRRFDPSRPVWVESESRTIGALRLPGPLHEALHAADCVRLDTPLPLRVALLLDDYAHFVGSPALLIDRLDALRPLRGHACVERWQTALRAGQVGEVVADLLALHYDPGYDRSMARHFRHYAQAPVVAPDGVGAEAMAALADRLLAAPRGPGGDPPAAVVTPGALAESPR